MFDGSDIALRICFGNCVECFFFRLYKLQSSVYSITLTLLPLSLSVSVVHFLSSVLACVVFSHQFVLKFAVGKGILVSQWLIEHLENGLSVRP